MSRAADPLIFEIAPGESSICLTDRPQLRRHHCAAEDLGFYPLPGGAQLEKRIDQQFHCMGAVTEVLGIFDVG